MVNEYVTDGKNKALYHVDDNSINTIGNITHTHTHTHTHTQTPFIKNINTIIISQILYSLCLFFGFLNKCFALNQKEWEIYLPAVKKRGQSLLRSLAASNQEDVRITATSCTSLYSIHENICLIGLKLMVANSPMWPLYRQLGSPSFVSGCFHKSL